MPPNVKFNEPDLEVDYTPLKCETVFEELLKNLDPEKQFPIQLNWQTENLTLSLV